ncbi:MAG: hypothetical protein LBG48_05760 [Rickettsiales bacterium]|jgi:hypothetical protein|nr:hypothetical protein [Rickettsiales bacterium]
MQNPTCPYCGAGVIPNANECPRCDTPINQGVQQHPNTGYPPVPPHGYPPQGFPPPTQSSTIIPIFPWILEPTEIQGLRII